jgi:hypothetical protein
MNAESYMIWFWVDRLLSILLASDLTLFAANMLNQGERSISTQALHLNQIT